MKRRLVLPLALGLAVFAVSALAMPNSFVFQQEIGLFLWTGDYFRDVFGGSFPICTLLGDFLVQFYRFPLVGPVCTALIVTGIFLLARGMIAKFSRHSQAIAMALSIAAWFVIARSSTPIVGVGILLALAVLRLASIPLKPRTRKPEAGIGLPITVLVAGVILILADPGARKIERWSTIETAARRADWDTILKVATPEQAEKDRDMVPFALLAAGSKGRLQQAMRDYRVQDPGEMDFCGVSSRIGYYFESLLYEQLGCTNEAIHNIYQCGCHMHRGTSFMVLFQLARYNIEAGNYTLVRKYCNILRRSPANRAMANRILKMYEGRSDVPVDGGPADSTPVITNNPIYNIVTLEQMGIDSPITKDRYIAYNQLLQLYQTTHK